MMQPVNKPTFKESPIQHMPEEMILNIFSFIEPIDMIQTLPLVCREWQQLASDGLIWKRLYFQLLHQHKMTPPTTSQEVVYLRAFGADYIRVECLRRWGQEIPPMSSMRSLSPREVKKLFKTFSQRALRKGGKGSLFSRFFVTLRKKFS